MKTLQKARQLANYIQQLKGHEFVIYNKKAQQGYNHIGALLTDSILQPGLNYKTVVYPRVQRLLNCYPDSRTTKDFLLILQSGVIKKTINWNNEIKIKRLFAITIFLHNENVECEVDLKRWIMEDSNKEKLRLINGIGPKTIDYMKNLMGVSTVAVDRHVKKFVFQAGVEATEYDEIKKIVEFSADLLRIPRINLDYSIWKYESMKSRKSNQISLFTS